MEDNKDESKAQETAKPNNMRGTKKSIPSQEQKTHPSCSNNRSGFSKNHSKRVDSNKSSVRNVAVKEQKSIAIPYGSTKYDEGPCCSKFVEQTKRLRPSRSESNSAKRTKEPARQSYNKSNEYPSSDFSGESQNSKINTYGSEMTNEDARNMKRGCPKRRPRKRRCQPKRGPPRKKPKYKRNPRPKCSKKKNRGKKRCTSPSKHKLRLGYFDVAFYNFLLILKKGGTDITKSDGFKEALMKWNALDKAGRDAYKYAAIDSKFD